MMVMFDPSPVRIDLWNLTYEYKKENIDYM